ncbi:MAG: sterol desaturase family protein [Deltaproteobacteria bacterium]|nr:sterol desaturase family protein [Deltaproteobacteria bacterium]
MDHFSQAIQDTYTNPLNILLVAAFVLAEGLLPAQAILRRPQVALDLLGFGAGVIFVTVIYGTLQQAVGWLMSLDPSVVLANLWGLPPWLKLTLTAVLTDFYGYWFHRSMHEKKWLWPTHRWHHSIEHLYWFSGFRASFLHILALALPQVLLPFYLLNMSATETALAIGLVNFTQFFKHANVRFPSHWLDWLFVTPHFHAIHHNRGKGLNKNFGFFLTVWDRVFGTAIFPKDMPRPFPMGLPQRQQKPVWRMVLGV